ncbi:lactate utilization protein C [candidate division KSB1 bacterium]
MILSWNMECLPYDVDKGLSNEKVIFGKEKRELQSKAEIGLTGCDAAVAETGSIILVSAEGKPKTASLLPYTHIALVEKNQILFGLEEYLTQKAHISEDYSQINIITGPSRTADIEMKLILGMHGPGKLIVIIGP